MSKLCALLAVITFGLSSSAVAQGGADSAAVAGVVGRFHAALAAGDSAAALALLAPDIVILESGGRENLAEYRSQHLPDDIRFAQRVPGMRGSLTVHIVGSVAWVTGTSETVGTMDGRPINSLGAELMVLSREPGGWRIRAIHWSSRRRS